MNFLDRLKNAKNEAVKIVKNIFTDEEQQRLDEAEVIKKERLQKQLEKTKIEEQQQAIRIQKNEIHRYGNNKLNDCYLQKDESLLKRLSDKKIEYKFSDDGYLIFTCDLQKSNQFVFGNPIKKYIDYRTESDFEFFEDDDIDGLQYDFTANKDLVNKVLSKIAIAERDSKFNQAATIKQTYKNEKMKDGDDYEF